MAEWSVTPPIEAKYSIILTESELINLRNIIYNEDLEGRLNSDVWKVINSAYHEAIK